jgi:hypothetical protein
MSISYEAISISSDATAISWEEIPAVADDCSYIFMAVAIVVKATAFSSEAKAWVYVVGR